MKVTSLLLWCGAPLGLFAQNANVKPTTIVVVHTQQTLPNLKNLGSVLVKDSITLKLTGTASGTGYMSVQSTSSLTINSSAGGIVYFHPSKNTLKNLSVHGNFSLGNRLNIGAGSSSGSVKIVGGLISDSFLVLRSDTFGTARIDSSSGSISGPVCVERYIPPRRSWRFLTVPFAASNQSINQAWQEGYINTTLACPSEFVGIVGFGTHLTHRGVDGYDPNTTQNPSLLFFSSALGTWVAPPSTLTKHITDYSAYAVFVRGDRTICLTQGIHAPPVPTTLRASGAVQIGSVVRTHTINPGAYLLEGNPYASSIDVLPMTLRSSGIVPETFWVWDPGIGETGTYIAYSYGIAAPATGNYPTPSSVRIVQSGQAYMLQAASSEQQLRYEESDKVTSSRSSVFARPTLQAYARIQLLGTDSTVLDGVVSRFVLGDTSHRTLPKFWNFVGPDIALERNTKRYSIETRYLVDRDTAHVYLGRISRKDYLLEISSTGIDSVWFVDQRLDYKHLISDTFRYRFTVSDSSSYRNRFLVVYARVQTQHLTSSIRRVYPNPVREMLYSTPPAQGEIRIVDILGVVRLRSNTFPVDCTSLARGVYVLEVDGEHVLFQKW